MNALDFVETKQDKQLMREYIGDERAAAKAAPHAGWRSDAMAVDKGILKLFKRQVKGFIKWQCDSDEQTAGTQQEDCKRVTKAKTFEEAEAVLKEHDHDGLFLHMVREGYF